MFDSTITQLLEVLDLKLHLQQVVLFSFIFYPSELGVKRFVFQGLQDFYSFVLNYKGAN